MAPIFPTLLRIVATFAIFCALQYIIPYYLLVIGGVVTGLFMIKTSDDRALALGILIGSILFGIFAFIMGQMYPS